MDTRASAEIIAFPSRKATPVSPPAPVAPLPNANQRLAAALAALAAAQEEQREAAQRLRMAVTALTHGLRSLSATMTAAATRSPR